MKKIEQLNLTVNKLLYEDYKSTERVDNEIYEIADIAEQIDSKQGLITVDNKLNADLVDDRNTSNKFIPAEDLVQISVNTENIQAINNTISGFGNIVTCNSSDFLSSNTKYGHGLAYSNSTLSLADQDGNALSSVEIHSSAQVDIDDISITKNSQDQIQTVGVIDQNTTSGYKLWVGTLAEYNQGVSGGTIGSNFVCLITDDTD